MSATPVIENITRISSRIIRILGCNPGPMTLQGTNTYLLGTGQSRILLDAGDADVPKYIENLNKVLKQDNLIIDKILLTHWHHDHIGGVKDILQINNNKDCTVWKFPRQDAPDIYNELPSSIKLHTLTNDQEINVDGVTLKVIHTPGHTTDHVVFTLKEENALFSGDCILGEGTTVFEDLFDYMKSLNIILSAKPSIIYPGHGNIIKDPIPKIEYYINHRNQREKQIFDVIKNSPNQFFNELDVVKLVYSETPKNLWPAACFNVNHHLKKLTKEGLIVETERDDSTMWKLKSTSSML